jgi:MFS transporter, UMF1 family
MYSWANHSWETTVATVLIGPWLLSLATRHRRGSATLWSVAGLHLHANAFPSAVLTVAALAQLVVLPPLGAAATRWPLHRMLAGSCVVGSLVAVALLATRPSAYVLAALLDIVGALAYGASNIAYNSYLPGLVGAAGRDALSSRGYAYGYLGGGLLLAANLLLLVLHGAVGLGKATAVQVCFASAGLWWAGFGLPQAWRLRDADPPRAVQSTVAQLRGGWRELAGRPHAVRYFVAYLVFSDAISAVIALSSTFITHELYDDSTSRAATFLFALILVIQFVAVAGAVGLGRVAGRVGTKPTLLASLAAWCLVIVFSYLAVRSQVTAVIAGVAIGTVLGGSQALARSLWSRMVPPGREPLYFAFFEVANEGTAWIAPLLFTVVVNVTGSYRQAILSLLVLFAIGAGLLARVDVDPAVVREGEPSGPPAGDALG